MLARQGGGDGGKPDIHGALCGAADRTLLRRTARTAGMKIMTDDNMGSEWRYFLALD